MLKTFTICFSSVLASKIQDFVRCCKIIINFIIIGKKTKVDNWIVVVVVLVVYLTTNQRHMGYLSSGNGHLAGRYSTP